MIVNCPPLDVHTQGMPWPRGATSNLNRSDLLLFYRERFAPYARLLELSDPPLRTYRIPPRLSTLRGSKGSLGGQC